MDVNILYQNGLTDWENVEPGQVFSYADTIYMRTTHINTASDDVRNCVNVKTGKLMHHRHHPVRLISDAQVTVTISR